VGIESSKSTLSPHLRVLREAGVIGTRLSGLHRYSSLRRVELGHGDALMLRWPAAKAGSMQAGAGGSAGA
jgi:DNA-binding transcriptional ArsR family regulator